MNAPPPVSVIVVSRGRPGLLPRCLSGIGQLYYPNFEVIVVTDPGGEAALRAMGWEDRVKLIPFDAANISAARNAGIAQAAGEVVAFIDDDAVPEPTWLSYLTAAFCDPKVAAVGGYVRGRNGISFQWRASLLNSTGETLPLDNDGDDVFIPDTPVGHAVKTEGTNCAFRRDILADSGGFDPVFRFFHDESDLNMRLANADQVTAISPLAQVHHGYAASDRRGADRAPTSLFEIGASMALFLRKHAAKNHHTSTRDKFRKNQRARLIRHLVSGGLEPRDIGRLMADLEAGFDEGGKRLIEPLAPIDISTSPFLPFMRKDATQKAVCMAGISGSRKRLYQRAVQQVRAGNVVTVYRLSPTALFHHVRFHKAGFWEQTGGIFGKANRREPLWQWARFRKRAGQERMRVALQRQNSDNFPHS